MIYIAALILFGLSAVAVISKLFFLAPTKAGRIFMLTNVVYETLFKKLGWQRWPIDLATVILLVPCWWVVAGPVAGLIFALVYTVAWGYAFNEECEILRCNPSHWDEHFKKMGQGIVFPLHHPRYILMLKGPVWDRGKQYDLGDWPVGHDADFTLMILNPSILRPQFPLEVDVACKSGSIEIERHFSNTIKAPKPGEYASAPFSIQAGSIVAHNIQIRVKVKAGYHVFSESLMIRSIFDAAEFPPENAAINRWKGGASAAFGWRGDMDLYDPMSFQSVEGMRHTLELCRRYRIASTLYLSGRLSLLKDEHEKYCRHLGVDRDTPGIDRFIRFMKEEVAMAPAIDFPYQTEKEYALEVGNHMFLHYGTNAAIDPGNNWKMNAWMGDGTYPWQSQDKGSFAEQRDNARHNVAVIKEKLGVEIRSWGVPGRVYDNHTPQAVEAAGMEVGSDTDASAWTNVMELPPPHHPAGTDRLVELTKKYPGDPDNAYKVATLKYWMALARRTRRTFIFMAHHHLLRYESVAGSHCAEAVLRHAMEGCKGDFYISTLTGIGRYWERVLCTQHRWVSVSFESDMIMVANKGDEPLENIPVEISFADNKQLLVLVNVPPKGTSKTQITQGNVS